MVPSQADRLTGKVRNHNVPVGAETGARVHLKRGTCRYTRPETRLKNKRTEKLLKLATGR